MERTPPHISNVANLVTLAGEAITFERDAQPLQVQLKGMILSSACELMMATSYPIEKLQKMIHQIERTMALCSPFPESSRMKAILSSLGEIKRDLSSRLVKK